MNSKKKDFRIKDILEHFKECKFEGDTNFCIDHAFALNSNEPNPQTGVTWVSDKNFPGIKNKINAGLLILSEDGFNELKGKDQAINFLISPNPRLTFLKLIADRFGEKRKAKIEKSAFLDDSVKLGKKCYIGRNVVIEENVIIGNNTQILHNTVILANTKIGNNVTIGCNCTIGNYGFGYEKENNGRYIGLEHLGNVVIMDYVEIHNNTCIDRAAMGSTVIEKNCKIDNQVHIAHGVIIKENSLIIANALIGGSTVIGKDCWIGPTSTIKNKITIGDNTLTGIGAVVVKDVKNNSVVIGNPAEDIEQYKKWSKVKSGIMDKKNP